MSYIVATIDSLAEAVAAHPIAIIICATLAGLGVMVFAARK